MATLEKRATPSQRRILRAVAGAVRNAAHAHSLELPRNFDSSVAKRATGTLSSQWPDVLAANSCQKGDRVARRDSVPKLALGGPKQAKGGRLGHLRRPPIVKLWKNFSSKMRYIKQHGTSAEYEAHIKVLRLLDLAQKELNALDDHEA